VSKLLRLKYTSLNSLDRQLETFLNFDYGYYVELGANNGISFSNSLYFERYRRWTGLLIEPAPKHFNELKRNRISKNYFSNAACVGFSYDQDSIALQYSDLMTTTCGIESDILDPIQHAKDGSKFWGGNSFEFFAPAKTLNSILDEAGSPTKVDLLSLDVEGVELEVLRGIDHSKYRFQYLCIESRSFETLNEYLELNGYKYVSLLAH
jgi:FkbM family methyltransferase